MREIKIPGVVDINHAALDAALRVALGDVYHGHSSGGSEGFRLHLSDAVTPEQVAQARAIVAAHDPTQLTDAQQAAQTRAEALAALEAQVAAIDLTKPLSAEAMDVVTRYNALRGLTG